MSEEEEVTRQWLGPWHFERLYGWWWRAYRQGSEVGQRYVWGPSV